MSAFAVKLDENLGRTHVRFLQELGYETDRIHVRARNKSRGAVLAVLRRVVAEQRLEELQGCLAVADEILTRVRRSASD